MAKYDFFEQYPGPNGPHLSCLTMFTLTRDESKRGGRGIHLPGAKKSNTCQARGDKQKAINGLRDHCARHPNDKQSETHLAWLEKPAA